MPDLNRYQVQDGERVQERGWDDERSGTDTVGLKWPGGTRSRRSDRCLDTSALRSTLTLSARHQHLTPPVGQSHDHLPSSSHCGRVTH